MTYTEISKSENPVLSLAEQIVWDQIKLLKTYTFFSDPWANASAFKRDELFQTLLLRTRLILERQPTSAPSLPQGVTINLTTCGCNKSQPEVVTKLDLERMEERLMATQQEVAARLAAILATVQKIGQESSNSLAKIEELKAALEAQGNASPEVLAAVEALELSVKSVDDLVPDAVPEQPPVEEPPAEDEPPTTEPAPETPTGEQPAQ